MTIKVTQSTMLRPDGDRILDAPFVEIDLNQSMEILLDEKTWETGDKNAITVYKTTGMRMVLIAMKKGAKMTGHKAEGIVSIQALKGSLKFDTEERSVNLNEGKMAVIYKGMHHSVEALGNCTFLLTIAG